MKATGLPAQITTAPAVEPVSATSSSSGADFVGMLMQLLGGNAPAAALPVNGTKSPAGETPEVDTEDPTALAAMLAVPVPMPLPWAAQPAPLTGDGADPLELLGLGSGGGKNAAALLALKTELTETLAEPVAEARAETGEGVGSLSPLTEAPKAAAAQAETHGARVLHTPVGTSQWADELGARMNWMVDRGQQVASLRLSPDNLGPLEVRISITDDKASVWFGAAHADTRAAIENALPRLREMFSAQGLSLTDAGVFQEPPRDQPGFTPTRSDFDSDAEGSNESEVVISKRNIGLLDAYA